MPDVFRLLPISVYGVYPDRVGANSALKSSPPFGAHLQTSPRISTKSRPKNSLQICALHTFSSLITSKSFPLNLFADPHPLTPVASIFYENIGGRGYLQLTNVGTSKATLHIYLFFQSLAQLRILRVLSFHIHTSNGGVYVPPWIEAAVKESSESKMKICNR
jgi:hypothetical protein